MTMSDDEFYSRAVARILRFMAILAGAGTLFALAWRGWRAGAGFALGSAIAWVNFLWLKRLTESLGASQPKRSTHSAVILGSRYLILGGVAYVIIALTSISLPALLTGLFVSLGAVLVEILFTVAARKGNVD
jgi:ATP synthase I chain